jgi:hypothetical protein
MILRNVLAGGAGLAIVCLAGTALAVTPPVKRPAALQAVVDCRQVADNAERLACYDSAVERMTKAEDNGDLVSIDRDQRRQVRRQAFGFQLPTLAMFDRGEKPEEIDRLDGVVAGARRGAEGWVLRLQDGSVWGQTDEAELSRAPHNGSVVVIRRGMLGSYMMNIDGQPSVRVKREQ